MTVESESIESEPSITTEQLVSEVHKRARKEDTCLSWLLSCATPAVVNGIDNGSIRDFNRGWTALNTAVYYDRSVSTVRLLLRAGADPNVFDADGIFPLHTAIAYRSEDRSNSFVKLLLEAGADPNIGGSACITLPLYAAIAKDRYSTVRLLLDAGADPSVPNPDGSFPLHMAMAIKGSEYEDESIVSLLLSKGANPNVQDRQGKTPLHYLLQVKPQPDYDDNSSAVTTVAELSSSLPLTPPLFPSYCLDYLRDRDDPYVLISDALLLVEADGFDPNVSDENGLTALHYLGHFGVFDFDEDEDEALTLIPDLIRKGANVDASDSQRRTPLFYAARAGHLEVLVGLLQAGADPNCGPHPLRVDVGLNNDTCLHLAARDGKDRIVAILLQAGADPNATNQHYQTPLFSAIEAGCLSSVEAIISAGANVNATDRIHENTPLHWAAIGGDISILDVLFRSGADAHKTNNFGRTPLMDAALADADLDTIFLFLKKDPTQVVGVCLPQVLLEEKIPSYATPGSLRKAYRMKSLGSWQERGEIEVPRFTFGTIP